MVSSHPTNTHLSAPSGRGCCYHSFSTASKRTSLACYHPSAGPLPFVPMSISVTADAPPTAGTLFDDLLLIRVVRRNHAGKQCSKPPATPRNSRINFPNSRHPIRGPDQISLRPFSIGNSCAGSSGKRMAVAQNLLFRKNLPFSEQHGARFRTHCRKLLTVRTF
jgi:hypothetical protein